MPALSHGWWKGWRDPNSLSDESRGPGPRIQRPIGQRLPHPDSTFDAAYLISVLGEIPDAAAALRELWRVPRPGARLLIAEVLIDLDCISLSTLTAMTQHAGFVFQRHWGPRFAYEALLGQTKLPLVLGLIGTGVYIAGR